MISIEIKRKAKKGLFRGVALGFFFRRQEEVERNNTDRVKAFLGEDHICNYSEGTACHESCNICGHARKISKDDKAQVFEDRQRALALAAARVLKGVA